MNRKIQLLVVIVFLLTAGATAQTDNKVRLSKTMYKGNDFSEVIIRLHRLCIDDADTDGFAFFFIKNQ